MVEADGRRSHELHLAPLEQFFVTTGTGTDYQGIGITDIVGTNLGTGQSHHLVGQKVQLFLDIRYLIVYYYLHFRLVLCAKLQNIFKLSMSNV